MKYHALFLFLKKGQNLNGRLLQIIGGTLWDKHIPWADPGEQGSAAYHT